MNSKVIWKGEKAENQWKHLRCVAALHSVENRRATLTEISRGKISWAAVQ